MTRSNTLCVLWSRAEQLRMHKFCPHNHTVRYRTNNRSLMLPRSVSSLGVHSLSSEPLIRCSVQPCQLQAVTVPWLQRDLPGGVTPAPCLLSSFLCCIAQRFAFQNTFDFLNYLKNRELFKLKKSYQGSTASLFKQQVLAPRETEVCIFHDV